MAFVKFVLNGWENENSWEQEWEWKWIPANGELALKNIPAHLYFKGLTVYESTV